MLHRESTYHAHNDELARQRARKAGHPSVYQPRKASLWRRMIRSFQK